MEHHDKFSLSKKRLSPICIYLLQDLGTQNIQEDAVSVYHNEFIALADGVGGSPYGRDAAIHVTEKATWYYTSAKKKYAALKDKKLFGERMFRSINTSILKEKSKRGIEEGFCTTLTVLLFSARNYYIYHTGDSAVYLINKFQVIRLTPTHRDKTSGYLSKWIGGEYFLPTVLCGSLSEENIFLVVSDGISDWITHEDIHQQVYARKTEEEKLSSLMNIATSYGSQDNKTAVLVFH